MKKTHTQKGFTLVELMVASVVFSVVLLVILSSFLQIGRMYYKGISLSNAQEAARRVSDDISNDIRFSSGAFVKSQQISDADPNKFFFCIGDHRYAYALREKITADNLDSPDAGIVQTTIPTGTCPPPTGEGSVAGSGRLQLLNPDMQLNRFDVRCTDGKCDIGLHIIFYGADNRVFTSPANPTFTPAQALLAEDARCTGALISSQFCAAVSLNSVILARQ